MVEHSEDHKDIVNLKEFEGIVQNPPKRGRGKKEERRKLRKQSVGEIQTAETESKERRKKNEDVLVISLGYCAVDCPGLLSEEKVLGIKKPPKNEADSSKNSFRPRSSSSNFYKHIFPEKSVKKQESEDHSNDRSGDEELPSAHKTMKSKQGHQEYFSQPSWSWS
ncbi:hypothetical protein OS493_016416 [Desmophyllum pertusum]|uniref:Uncharacterized protein n=1 Tax=Desmophyllum pertusum TaxID=174260 RepID=A0A9W9ZQH7_9CNID|nr:hypothetical protein OS493_016416 [Desmophyllum pertusum]